MYNNSLTPFLTEVYEQPKTLADLISFYRKEGKDRLAEWWAMAKSTGRVVFSGMGTSEFAPELVLETLAGAGIDATFIDAGELLHYSRPVKGLLVLISQSGESAEVRELAVRSGDKKNIVAMTNTLESTLARNAGLVLPMLAGHETAISTKTYVNTLALLYLMAQGSLDRLDSAVEALKRYDAEGIERASEILAESRAVHFIGRGPAMAAVRQAALTFMEGTRTYATAMTGGTFRHGPFELVDETHRSVFFIPGGKTYNLLKNMVLEVIGKGGLVVITDQALELPAASACVLRVADLGEELFALSAAATQELLLDALARRRGVTAGIFRHGQKITSRE